jgi:hypothetical protein
MMKRKSFLRGVICSMVVAVSIIGCSLGPSDRMAKDDLQKWFEGRWPGTVLVIECEVVNKGRDGRKYVIEYRAKAQFIKDTEGCVPTCCGDVCFDKLVAGFRWITKASDNPHVIQKGDLFETRGRSTCTRTGKGWSCENL